METHVSKPLAAAMEPQTKDAQPPTVPPAAEEILKNRFLTLADLELEAMREAALRFCAELQARTKPRWLSLLGPSGSGKTTLAKAINEFVRERGGLFKIGAPGGYVTQSHSRWFVHWPEMVAEMKQGDFTMLEELCGKEPNHMHWVTPRIWFAAVDDIGQVEDSQKAYLLGALARLFDARLGTWTVFTSNLKLEQIAERLDPRIASRMIRDGNIVVENSARDWSLR